ncbi:MAG: SRPBCC family protein [Deltaproteobacteria bacterium]|nr:SRPBCC family protein [Deltaproteobacteria bacterium]
MITIAMTAVINAEQRCVWRALTDPGELVSWHERIIAPVESPDAYPFSGQHVRWRYMLGTVQLVMHDRPLEVVELERLSSAISVGSMRYEQTFTLQPEPGPPIRTRLGMRVAAENSIAVIGDVVDRFEVRRMAAEHIDSTLRALTKWCENRT